MENVCVFNIGSIHIQGKESLRKFTIHQKYREQSHDETDVWHVWKVDSRTIRWDFWSESNLLGRFFMEVFVFDWWRTSHQSPAHKSLRILRFCIVPWKDERNPQSNIAWEDRLTWFKSSPEYRALDRSDGEPMEFEWNIFVKTAPLKSIFAVWISTRNSRTGQKVNKFGALTTSEQDWWRNAKPEHHIDARHLIADPVFRVFYGQRTSDWGRTTYPKSTCWRQPKLLIWCWSWNCCTRPGKPYDFKFVAFTDTHRDLVWMNLLTPKSKLDLTVDLNNWVIDVRSKDWDVPPTRVTELKYAKDQGFCATLSYVAFTDNENMIGDAMPIQNTAFDASRLFADPVSWSFCCSLRAAVFYGQRTWMVMHCESREYRVDVSRSYWSWSWSCNYCRWPGKSYDFEFVAFTD